MPAARVFASTTVVPVVAVVLAEPAVGCDPLLEMEDCDGTCVSILIGTLFVGDGSCDGAYPINFNCAEYSYDGGDCSSSGGGSGGDTGGSGGTDTGGGTPGEYTCTDSSFAAQTASATNANQAVVYSALSARRDPSRLLCN